MEPFAIYPDPPQPELVRALDFAGYGWVALGDQRSAEQLEPGQGWGGAIICAEDDVDGAFAICRALRRREVPVEPLLLLVRGNQLDELDMRDELYDDFCISPFQPSELESRLKHLLWRAGTGARPDMIEYGPLALNLETYQAAVDGLTLDLTYMEYELLKFLASNPGKVFTREILLNRVWGYDYYGGARTVDVHVRRLRAKLGEEHAGLIQTVRSVGYRFGQSRWTS